MLIDHVNDFDVGDLTTLGLLSWMASLLCIGALFGSLSAVFLMDAVGRKVS